MNLIKNGGKKLLAVLTASAIALSMSTSAFAKDAPTPESAVTGKIELSGEATTQNDVSDVVTINASDLKKTGETIDMPKERAGQTINNQYGVLTGTLTSTNTWDYYLFPQNVGFASYTKIETTNTSYTMTLGVANIATGNIALTSYVVSANKSFGATFGPLDNPNEVYAWIIQSSNSTYGSEYKFQYNKAISNMSNVICVSNDLQKLYELYNGELGINGQYKNIDYRYDVDWDFGYEWHRTHIWLVEPKVKVAYVGGTRYYGSTVLIEYPNSILFEVLPGGTFTHEFAQNPPYHNWGMEDAAGNLTPRDFEGGGYLIYDLDTDKVVEFANGLTVPWTKQGDLHSLSTY